MMREDREEWLRQRHVEKLRNSITMLMLGLAALHVVFPGLGIDTVTVVLVGLGIAPWLAPIFKSVELPGGVKFEFHEQVRRVRDRAEAAGIRVEDAPEPAIAEDQPAYVRAFVFDVNLGLAGLRIELEQALRELCTASGAPDQGRSAGQLINVLHRRSVLTGPEVSVMRELTQLLNQAVHGVEVRREDGEWAMDFGASVVRSLRDRIDEQAQVRDNG